MAKIKVGFNALLAELANEMVQGSYLLLSPPCCGVQRPYVELVPLSNRPPNEPEKEKD